MRSLRTRFILSHLLPLLIIIPLAGVAFFYILETQILLNNLERDLTEQANLVSTEAVGQTGIWDDPAAAQAFLQSLSERFQGQVTLLSPSGQPIGGMTPQPPAGSTPPANNTPTYQFSAQTAVISVPIRNIDQELVGIVQVTQEVESLSGHFVQLRWLFLGVLTLELLVGSLIGLVLALRLERPIHTLTSAVSEIASGQPVNNTVTVTGPEELRVLGQAINSLSQRLKELEEARRHLLANVVHELGRPLGAVHSAIHVLRQDNLSAELRQELLSGIDAELERLQPLLDDLTRLHGQKLGARELTLQPLALNDWLQPLLQPWRAAAQEKDLVWQVSLTPNLPPLQADPDRLAQVVGNLLSNALKYTPPNGKISVETGRTGGDLWLRIADTGPGIAAEDLPHLFAPFYRGQQEHRFPKGLGLGLTIAQDIVVAHNGRIQVDSELKRGSQFTVYIPLNITPS